MNIEERVIRDVDETTILGSLALLEDSVTGHDPTSTFERFPPTEFFVYKPNSLVRK